MRTQDLKVRIGLAGWSNPPMQKMIRGAASSHLEHYSKHFSCVEINSSFYRPHRSATYATWKLATPRTFRFAVKMPRSITHESGLRGTKRDIKEFFASVEALQPKLGVVLIQLPPSLEFQGRVARAFFDSIPRLFGTELACEPRHASWFTDAADALLRRLDVARVAADPARVPEAREPGGSHRHAYYRWHGSPRMYYSSYSEAQLDDLAAALKRRRDAKTWCIFDNTARHAAWDNALYLARAVA